jgi:hypothetical protein
MRSCHAANVRTNRNHQRWMLRSIRDAIRSGPHREAVPWGVLPQETYCEVARLLAEQGLIGKPSAFHEFHQPPGTAERNEE